LYSDIALHLARAALFFERRPGFFLACECLYSMGVPLRGKVHVMIQKLRLSHFRNFDDKFLEFPDGVTVIVGENARGKTNILESIFLLSSGKSFKANTEEEMIQLNEELARVKGRVVNKSEQVDLEVILIRPRKKLLVNGVARRMVDFSGNLKVVLFGPWDMDLVTESPSNRRKFLDTVLSLVDREYRRSLLSYEKGLRQRNRLLLRIREEGLSRTQLMFWDRLLIKNGDYISHKREEFFAFINATPAVNDQAYKLVYDKSAISESRLLQYKNQEVSAATTLVGPHRDDFAFVSGERNLASFGSRGEQRMAVLWLKLAELSYVEQETDEKPTLLLDDIFSELDHEHREQVWEIAKNQQTIITTADEHFVSTDFPMEKIELVS
jgi:DNA replication and repair protein RecF